MSSAWDDPQMALFAEPSQHTRASRICPNCKRHIRRIWPGEACSIALDIDPEPTTRKAALLAIIEGTPAVVAKTTKRDRGAGMVTTYTRLTRSTIGSSYLAPMPHHIAHRCGVTNPPPPPDEDTTRDYPATPPF